MHKWPWLASGIIMLADFAVLMVYRDVVAGSHLFVTTGTVLYPVAALNLIAGILCLIAFIRSAWFNRGGKGGR